MNLQEAAHHYADMGWAVFPVKPGTKTPLVKWRDQSTMNHEQIDAWWAATPDANVGIDCGTSQLAVIDVDDLDAIPALAEAGIDLDRITTLEAATPRGGRHIYFGDPAGIARNSQSVLAPKVDVRGVGGYVLAAPSRTDAGEYRWLDLHPLELVPDAIVPPDDPEPYVPPAPTTPTVLAEPWARAALEAEIDAVAAAAEGTRNARLFTAGLKLYGIARGGYLDAQHVTDLLLEVAQTRAGQTLHEATSTLRSAWDRSVARGPSDRDRTPGAPSLVEPPRADGPDDGEPGFDVLDLAGLANLPPPRWVLPHRIPVGLTWLIGHPKAGKSFVALDWAAATAAAGARVLYFAGEGVHGFAHRVLAWHDAHPSADLSGLGVVPTVPRLLDPDSVSAWYRTVRRAEPDLVILDTWSRCTAGADENSHKDMSSAIDAVGRMQEAYGPSVLVVHHTNVAGARARGHTSLDGAADGIWHVRRDDDAGPGEFEVENTASKDFPAQATVLGRIVSHGRSAIVEPSAHDRYGLP